MAFTQKLSTWLPGRLAFEVNRMRKRYLPAPRHRQERELLGLMGHPTAVMQGPFRGMKYVDAGAASSPINDLLGMYELELHPSIERLIAYKPDLIIDVGTATGYYAVGLAVRLPEAKVIGYDISKYARAVTRRVVAMNNVDRRVEVRGACTPEELQKYVTGARRPFIVSDCEGYEGVLLDPNKVPALKHTYMLVELHDMFVPGVSQRIRDWYSPTHTIEKIVPRPRTMNDLPPGVRFSPEQLTDATNESRTPVTCWFEMVPKNPK